VKLLLAYRLALGEEEVEVGCQFGSRIPRRSTEPGNELLQGQRTAQKVEDSPSEILIELIHAGHDVIPSQQ
jgi:hypothetical protein